MDLKAFQSTDSVLRERCVKAIIPELLRKSQLDLDVVVEFCRQFDVEPGTILIITTIIILLL